MTMAMYNLYAGLGGGFGGANYQETCDFDSKDDALEAAYALATEEYDSYSGCNGLMSYGDFLQDYLDENNLTEDELTVLDFEDIDAMYTEEVEGWIDYYVTTLEEDPDHDH